MDLNYTIREQPWKATVAVLKLSGQLDRAFQPEMDDAIQAVIDKGARYFAVDLGELEYLSSAGIASLVNLRGRLERVTGDACLFGANARVSKVLDVMGMKRACPYFDSEEDARQNFPG